MNRLSHLTLGTKLGGGFATVLLLTLLVSGLGVFEMKSISGSTEDVMKQDSQEERWAAFGWNVLSIPGNDVQAIDAALTLAAETKGKPTVIILNTVKGYGSPVMEDKAGWHHHLPNDEEYAQIIADFAAHKEAING